MEISKLFFVSAMVVPCYSIWPHEILCTFTRFLYHCSRITICTVSRRLCLVTRPHRLHQDPVYLHTCRPHMAVTSNPIWPTSSPTSSVRWTSCAWRSPFGTVWFYRPSGWNTIWPSAIMSSTYATRSIQLLLGGKCPRTISSQKFPTLNLNITLSINA